MWGYLAFFIVGALLTLVSILIGYALGIAAIRTRAE
jgi:hypothetical protein